ncbi:hypothetical protein RF11_15509 [Thelohanellus kitauei]|uniref:Uncharacterized protein n=1 Tax=Thelohanellus kitauei TaxID=669202 RepID=A0A0C2J4T7_THEKT|nr:hypothetical protein RF11_15509 [Thelohanellus kitauei]
MHQPETDNETKTLSSQEDVIEPKEETFDVPNANQASAYVPKTRNYRTYLDSTTFSSSAEHEGSRTSDSVQNNPPLKIKIESIDASGSGMSWDIPGNDIKNIMSEPQDEPPNELDTDSDTVSTSQIDLTPTDTVHSAGESEIERASLSRENIGNRRIPDLSGDIASTVDTDSTSTSTTKKTSKTQSKLTSHKRSAEDCARDMIKRRSKDPSFCVDKNGVRLSQEQMAQKIIESGTTAVKTSMNYLFY